MGWPGGNMVLAGSTLVAAIFVAVQAFYARTSFVAAQESRLLEKKLDLCFETFDAAAALDAALRQVAPGPGLDEHWPPEIVVESEARLTALQRSVVPRLDALQSELAKAEILGPLDKYRAYLAQQLEGLSKRLLDIPAGQIGEGGLTDDNRAVIAALSEFLGAQYTVFTGCRLVAEGEV
ncbi:hypothetical protein [Vannielia litorea]|uniref:Uncharacterized protein n=1 Tax=Vannielia litorea TaxID=1217970 RepID=A0A1N6FSG6_9RHOB|nr:hypothetical protein [Vannielia litorea]SIN98259.1 hypothetical protein SAMN05444002_1923 [Vannielia litorea]